MKELNCILNTIACQIESARNPQEGFEILGLWFELLTIRCSQLKEEKNPELDDFEELRVMVNDHQMAIRSVYDLLPF